MRPNCLNCGAPLTNKFCAQCGQKAEVKWLSLEIDIDTKIDLQMEIENYTLHKLKNGDTIPFDLLLLADETEDAIEKYIYDSDIYTVLTKDNLSPIGVFALYKINDSKVEIKNIAILESFRGQDMGSFLIVKIKEIAIRQNYKEIIVGTADVAIKEIQFYEKNGFKKYDVKKNFFIENYPEPIIENGIMLKDMIMLKTQIA